MKRVNIIVLMMLLFVGCDKSKDIYEEINFGVRLSSASSYVAGDEVTFEFSGNAGYILFYTGEEDSKYDDSEMGTPLDIKSLTTDLNSYSYTYDQAGEYTATFVATSANAYGSSRAIKSLTFVIAESPDTSNPTPDPDNPATGGGSIGDVGGSNDSIFPDDPATGGGSIDDVGGSNDDIFPMNPTHDSSLSDISGTNTDIFTE